MREANSPNRSILVVDDEPLIRINLADFFEDEGFSVFEAEDADTAIAILETNPSVRIVLTDVRMPGSMDGVKLAHHVRDRFPPTLLVVASGAVKLSADELPDRTMFLSKPFDPRFVLDEIRRLS
ncbi:Response regulator receiver domain-containing protein [Sphingomonas gellani]|uniref:Response regulator receiver domain-containing protein n=1 Tax=Sphingomonas gellani TaxID=1166340 RepID=A0A1H8J5P2_9SPHN|nr:response regulator [Sphingomonas gellani]SEN76160.1 Response regulator receiver domain-containing protein [Sphingomonas gellani]